MNLETFDEGRLQVDADFAAILRANQLDTFANFMARQGGRVVRDFPGRRTVRLELKAPGGGTTTVYLKRYETAYLAEGRWLRRRLGLASGADEAMSEWQSLQQVGLLGIHTARAIAVGQERSRGIVTRSFLMTEEIPGAVEGDVFLSRLEPAERWRLMRQIASLARRFHHAGFVHKDFYLGHILIVPAVPEPKLFLIDLQRVTKPCCFRGRWLAKDLAAMAYSCLRAGASRTDLMRFAREYFRRPRLGRAEKRLARRVVWRIAWLATRRPKHDPDFDPAIPSGARRSGLDGVRDGRD